MWMVVPSTIERISFFSLLHLLMNGVKEMWDRHWMNCGIISHSPNNFILLQKTNNESPNYNCFTYSSITRHKKIALFIAIAQNGTCYLHLLR